jgi:hypothetical protein
MVVLIVVNLAKLIRDYRRHVPGSRLRARMVTLLVMLAITPLVGMYIFSVEFINRGIDNWFSVDIGKALITRWSSVRPRSTFKLATGSPTSTAWRAGSRWSTATASSRRSTACRARSGAIELRSTGRTIKYCDSSANPDAAVPGYPSDEVLLHAAG